MQRGNTPLEGGNDNLNNMMDHRISANAQAASRNSLALARLQSQQHIQQQMQQMQQQMQNQQQQSAVASFLAGSRHGVPNIQSLLYQQQNQQLVHPGLLAGVGTDLALRRHEEQVLATHLLLQHPHLEDLLTPSTTSAGANNPTVAHHLLSHLSGRAGIEQTEGSLAQRMPSMKQVPRNDNEALLKQASASDHLLDLHRKSEEPFFAMANPAAMSSANLDEPTNADGSDDDKDEDSKNPAVTGATENFPMKLHRMIEEAEKEGKDDIISFLPHGRAFAIHKPRQFISEIMPKYFTTSRMPSFQRQLNLYGFRRITEGRDKGGYFHDFFLKGRKKLCMKIKRKKTNTKAPPNLFGSTLGLSQVAPNVQSFSNRELLMRHAINGGIDAPLTRASLGQGLLANNLLPAASAWSGMNPTGNSQEAALAALIEQQKQHAASNHLRLQQLQQTQLLDELERQEQLRRGPGS